MNRLTMRGLAILTVLATPLFAQSLSRRGSQQLENRSQSEVIRRVYAPVVRHANRSVVQILVDGEAKILGTVVGNDLVVTKNSELAGDGDEPKWTCRLGKQSWPCTRVAFDRPSDLALLRVTGAELTPVVWQTRIPATGALLATPDGSELPLGIGVLSARPYVHTRPRPFLGIRFANPNGGPAELDEAIEHGAARAAGLRAGDVIVRFDDQEIADTEALRSRILSKKPGDKVQVKVRRDDAELTFDVTLGTNTSTPASGQEGIWGDLSSVRSGFLDVFQHDTIIKPEDCGGPVVDLTGKALGVNIARAGRVETLALPAANVQQLVERMRPAAVVR